MTDMPNLSASTPTIGQPAVLAAGGNLQETTVRPACPLNRWVRAGSTCRLRPSRPAHKHDGHETAIYVLSGAIPA